MTNGEATSSSRRRSAGVTNAGPRNHSRSSSSRTRTWSAARARGAARPMCPMATRCYPFMIFRISPSAQAIASLVGVPVTALAIMFGRMNELVMSWTRSLGGAGQPRMVVDRGRRHELLLLGDDVRADRVVDPARLPRLHRLVVARVGPGQDLGLHAVPEHPLVSLDVRRALR